MTGAGLATFIIGIISYDFFTDIFEANSADPSRAQLLLSWPCILGGGIALVVGTCFIIIPDEYTNVADKYMNMPEGTYDEIKHKCESGEEYLKLFAEKGEREKHWCQSEPSYAEKEYRKYREWKSRQDMEEKRGIGRYLARLLENNFNILPDYFEVFKRFFLPENIAVAENPNRLFTQVFYLVNKITQGTDSGTV